MLIVFGSISMELHIPVDQFSTTTTHALAHDYTLNAGGKAANQAYAATRSGAKVALIGKTGDDDYAKRILDKVRREGVITSGVGKSDNVHTGLDIICTNKENEIQITKSPGANAYTSAEQIPEEILKTESIVLIQSDIDMNENAALLKKAKEQGAQTIMNLSPSINISHDILQSLDYLILNSKSASKFAQKLGIPADSSTDKIALALSKLGELTCIITKSEQGSITYTSDGKGYKTPALKLESFIDHHGAEDAYCGTFAACLYARKSITECLKRASIAASLSCEQKGGLHAFPYLADIEERLDNLDDPTES
ncbi:MAG: PfkB family carbohydrate kinase [Bdellovibrionales bacterium]